MDRFLGLLNPSNPRSMLFITRFGIHTFFMKECIDVLVLDSDNKVRVVKKSLSPNRLFFYPIQLNKVLELPAGFIALNKIKLNDKIEFIS